MEDLGKNSILAKLKGSKRPILELLKEKQARAEAYQQALDAGDYNGQSELGSTRAERRANEEMSQPGMNEGGVGGDENLTAKIINFLKAKKLRPAGLERGAPMTQRKNTAEEESPLPQPLSEEEIERRKSTGLKYL